MVIESTKFEKKLIGSGWVIETFEREKERKRERERDGVWGVARSEKAER